MGIETSQHERNNKQISSSIYQVMLDKCLEKKIRSNTPIENSGYRNLSRHFKNKTNISYHKNTNIKNLL